MAMLYPTYRDIIKKVNSTSTDGEPIIVSRYSVVVAAAKRARQLVDGGEPKFSAYGEKPLAVAIEELDKGLVRVIKPTEDMDAAAAEAGAENEPETGLEPEADTVDTGEAEAADADVDADNADAVADTDTDTVDADAETEAVASDVADASASENAPEA